MSNQHRQIRAVYDEETITVYQAYNEAIAGAAVEHQRLDASPLYRPTRMTWIKPSWNWMMYRSGYSYKDANQSNILALKVKREFFERLLTAGVLSEEKDVRRGDETVRVQWDPERSARIGRLGGDRAVRSIQIGIPKGWTDRWLREGVVGIEDVTTRARDLRKVLDEEKLTEQELAERGLVPKEKVYVLPEEVAKIVRITED